MIRPARSGWAGSAPLSRTATVTPFPVSPAAHASGVPIRALDSAIAAVTRPSSHTPAIPSRPVSSRHRPRPLSAATAAPRTLRSVRVRRVPRGVAIGAPRS
ncbi:hypothetical protein SFUMM280S_08115 [Streptomyces fumanus]